MSVVCPLLPLVLLVALLSPLVVVARPDTQPWRPVYTSHLPPSPHHHRRSPDIDTDSCVSLVDSRLEVLEELAEVHSK